MTGLVGGRYELAGILGRGGMAEVHKAWDTRLDRPVAVKTLRADLAHDAPYRARFRREAHAVAGLGHPNIVAVYDSGETAVDGVTVPYIVMEYVDGRPLSAVLREGPRLAPRRALEVVDEILGALDHAHRAGIVHRDIKPSNVMVTASGEVKVMDFGIARPLGDAAATLTAASQVVGTAQYMSPEQVRGERVDARSDLYSTGCLLYELLTGRPPFTGATPAVIAERHISGVAPPPTRLDPALPGWVDALVAKAMAKDRSERYQSAAEMRADVRRALRATPAEATVVVPAPPPAAPGRPAPTLVLSRPVPDDDLPPVRYARPPRPGSREPRAGRGRTIAWILVTLLLAGVTAGVTYVLTGRPAGTAEVPNVVGLTRPAAEKAVSAAGLRPDARPGFSDEQQAGYVFRTDPAAGQSLARGDRVVIWVSNGPEQVVVPDVAGRPEAEAEQELRNLGLLVNVTREPSDTVAAGLVLRTDPAAGTEVDKRSTVAMPVSSGQEPPDVPDVVGRTESEAVSLLGEAGFVPDVRYVPAEDPAASGTVLTQAPVGGTPAEEGTTVTIWVTGPPAATPSATATLTTPAPPTG